MATRLNRWLHWLLFCALLVGLLPPAQPSWAQEPPTVDDAAPSRRVYLPFIQQNAGAATMTDGDTPQPDAGSGDAVVDDGLVVLESAAARQASTCDLYPLALHSQSLTNVAPGTLINDILNGAGAGNFGWLTWNGKNNVAYLVAGLTPPGNAHTYRNPHDRNDRQLSVGDWASGRPGLANSKAIRNALDKLKRWQITVPVWGATQGDGANAQYQIVNFALVRLIDYRLPGQNRISVRFLGYNPTCGQPHAPEAVADTYSTDEDTPLTIPAPGVLSNDTDEAHHYLKAIQLGDVTRLTLDESGAFHYTPPPNFAGNDTFYYQATDAIAASNVATITITVSPINDAPVAHDDQATITEGTPVVIPVLSNDLDVDGDLLTITQVGAATLGTATAIPAQMITYTPAPQVSGTDRFTYTICDPGALCATAAVTVVIGGVNDPPVANDDQATTPEATPVTIDVAANDSDPDGNLLPGSALTLTNPLRGVVAVAGAGRFTYTPNTNHHGLDQFRYTICDDGAPDGVPLCATATVTIAVTPVNDAPVAAADFYTATEDTLFTVAAPGLLVNDQDVDGDLLTVKNFTQPAHGALTQQPDGGLRYLPNADYCGADSYSYTATDGQLAAAATVTLAITCVNDPPLAQDDVYAVNEDESLTVSAPGLLSNDRDPDGDPLVVQNHTQPAHGVLTQTNAGALVYTPQPNFCGADNYVYTVVDGKGGSTEATVSLQVSCNNDPPTATNDSYSVDAGQRLITAAPGMLGNDADPENDPLTAQVVDGPANGVLTLRPDGSFVYTPTNGFIGIVNFTYTANDATLSSAVATVTITVNDTSIPDLPPDPAEVAPPLDLSVATNLASASQFLYTGDNPIQAGVASGTIEGQRVAVIRGRVLQRDGQPLPGVAISVKDHPEFGQTLSRLDGMFDLAVNGGGLLTLNYQQDGFLPAQRQVQTPWQDYVWVDDVALVTLDSNVTPIDLTSSAPIQVAQGSVVTDGDGTRQATLLILQGTTAEMTLPDGTTQALTTLTVRATEYTVGENGPEAMPGQLPPQSGYTYAVEISADEALAAGATDVRFSQPVHFYVENFLDFPVGGIVPVGYYDQQRGQWVPSQNGRIIALLGITGGLADLDVDGSGQVADAAALAELGITTAEREQLATLYSPGQSLWRVPMTHFTPWDCNWPYGPPTDAAAPGGSSGDGSSGNSPLPLPEQNDSPLDDFTCQGGSIIECESQTLREEMPIAGTPFSLYYGSDRVAGRTDEQTLDIPLSGANTPATLKKIELIVAVAGKQFVQEFPAQPSQTARFVWDGKDAYGRTLQGGQNVRTRINYVYDAVYMQPAEFAQSFAKLSGVPIEGIRARQEIKLGRNWAGTLTYWSGSAANLGSWSLNIHHSYDPTSRQLFLGDGRRRSAEVFGRVINTVGGVGSIGYSGDGGPATAAAFTYPFDVVVGEDGSLLIADRGNQRIRKITPDGVIHTVAGNGTAGFSGDGGPALGAALREPAGIALGADGSIYIADTFNHRIRRVTPDGVIQTVAGNGAATYGGDGGSALKASLQLPHGVAVGADGTIYIADTYNNRVRMVTPDGIIQTVAGNSTAGYSGDGGPASAALLSGPNGVAVGADGTLYIADTGNHRVRLVTSGGLIQTVAGNGIGAYSGDGGRAVAASLQLPFGVSVGSDGSLYIADTYNHRVRLVTADGIIQTVTGSNVAGYGGDGGPAATAALLYPYRTQIMPDGSLHVADTNNHRVRRVDVPLPGYRPSDIAVPSDSGDLAFIFDSSGRHQATLNTLTGATVHTFSYDGEGRLSAITDGDGNITTIERDANHAPTAIVGPFGQRTTLSVDANGYLASMTNPANETTRFVYTADGLMTGMTDARNQPYRFTYDDGGRLVRDEDPVAGAKSLAKTSDDTGYTVTFSTAEGRTTTYRVERIATGGVHRINTLPDGTFSDSRRGTDGRTVTLSSDGTRVDLLEGPDPRFGMQAPLVKSQTVTTPGDKTLTTATERTVALMTSSDPLSLTSLTERTTINGRTYTSIYNAATRTFTRTSPAGRQSTTTIDELGRVLFEEVAGLLPTSYTYDSRGRLATISQGTDADSRTTTFTYNSQGLLAAITDPLNRTVRFTYDAAGRVLQQTMPDNRVISYTYDAGGNLTSLTPPGQPAHTFNYTPVNLEERYTPPALGSDPVATAHSYNLDRQVTQIALPTGQTIDMGYDNAGRLSTVAFSRGVLQYSYNATTGRLDSVTAPDNLTLAYQYDGSLPTTEQWSGAIAGTVARTYDNEFRLTALAVNGNDTVNYLYDTDSLLWQVGDLRLTRDGQNGLLTGSQLGNVTDSWRYNGFGEPSSYRAAYNAAAFYDVQFERDALGRIVGKTEMIDGVTDVYNYRYDLAGRLIEVTKNQVTTASYTYDDNGNRLTYTNANGMVTGTYDAQDRLLRYGDATYTYTADGRLLTKTVSGQITSYTYDELGNLIAVALPDGTQIEYLIDGANRRVGKKVNGVLVQGFLYQDGLNPVAELDGAGNVVSRFVYGSRGNAPDYIIMGGTTYRIIADHLGSPRHVVDVVTGQVMQQILYDEFGNVLVDTNTGFQPFGFAGGLWDKETGLVRFGARDYDPVVGRWTSKDPIIFDGATTNLYSFVNNDPQNRIDPYGLFDWGSLMNDISNSLTLPQISGNLAGAIFGKLAGGYLGGWIGGALGTFLAGPPHGTILGVYVGRKIGAGVGAWLGGQIGGNILENIINQSRQREASSSRCDLEDNVVSQENFETHSPLEESYRSFLETYRLSAIQA